MTITIPWVPQPGPQQFAIERPWVEEMLYGGAVGGGKTDFLLGDFAQDIPTPHGKNWQGILFRRTYPQLQDIIKRAYEIYPLWFPNVRAIDSGTTWIWPNGAELRLRHMESETAWTEYQGHAYGWIGFDELGEWPSSTPYLRMQARLRSAHNVPNKRIRCTANPGGAGHAWLKNHFGIDRWPNGQHIFEEYPNEQVIQIVKDLGITLKEYHPMRRMFVLSKLSDNKKLLEADPQYITRLFNLGGDNIIKAWLAGDWDAIGGAYFTEWNAQKHVIKPFEIPNHWVKFKAMDWGSAKPFCVLWFAVSDGVPFKSNDRTVSIPRDSLVVFREWYGMVAGRPNVGLKLDATEVADGIKELEGEKCEFNVIDPAACAHDGGPSIAEAMATRGVYFTPADNSRIAGWNQVRSRLKGDGNHPLIYFFDTCTETIRTVPTMQHDVRKLEDLDSKGEDHAADTLRYGCMARSFIRDLPKDTTAKFPTDRSFNELRESITRRRMQENTD